MNLLLSILLFTLLAFSVSEAQQLREGFYAKTCPAAEKIVRNVVREAAESDPNMAAILLRLHFHDCFVEGCDGSILIEGINAEKSASGHAGVGGFEVIERAKRELESACPGTVSCADIVALAARDSILFSQGPDYDVPTGRRDGRVSNVFLANDMPDVRDSAQQLKDKFSRKGLTPKDLVVLNAAHTIGTTACFFMQNRLYNFFGPGSGSDPAINPNFLPDLQSRCPPNGNINVRLPIDEGSERRFDRHILENIRNGRAVLESDARLREDFQTGAVIESYFGLFNQMFGSPFGKDFVDSMVKMGQIGVKTGSQGEIRRTCSRFNK